MLYLGKKDIEKLNVSWKDTTEVIQQALYALKNQDFSQPIKPYVRFKDPSNRIIAMPAYVGEEIDSAGIKWIASFPKNIYAGKARANSAVILNNTNTGEIEAFFNTALTSIIRTVSVSGLVLKEYMSMHKDLEGRRDLKVGIIGWGPIGQNHYKMVSELLHDRVETIYLYDINGIKKDVAAADSKIVLCNSWEQAYVDCDVVTTCTVSDKPYIDKNPKKGSLQLNVSLRDYTNSVYESVKQGIVVDSWAEVCRENTDIERMHLEKGLDEKDVLTLVELVIGNEWTSSRFENCLMFNPMGMAVFDISICKYLYQKAVMNKVGLSLE